MYRHKESADTAVYLYLVRGITKTFNLIKITVPALLSV